MPNIDTTPAEQLNALVESFTRTRRMYIPRETYDGAGRMLRRSLEPVSLPSLFSIAEDAVIPNMGGAGGDGGSGAKSRLCIDADASDLLIELRRDIRDWYEQHAGRSALRGDSTAATLRALAPNLIGGRAPRTQPGDLEAVVARLNAYALRIERLVSPASYTAVAGVVCPACGKAETAPDGKKEPRPAITAIRVHDEALLVVCGLCPGRWEGVTALRVLGAGLGISKEDMDAALAA